MRFALREFRRRPGKFAAAIVILTFVSVLIVYLGGLIDGTTKGGTGALRAQDGRLMVFADTARLSIPESRIDASLRQRIEQLPEATEVGGLGITQLGARLPGAGPRDLIDVSVVGYDLAGGPLPQPPAAGEALADVSLRSAGVRVGMTLTVGPERTPLTVVGFVSDTTYDGQGTLWTPMATWREVQNANRPAKAAGQDGQQVVAVNGAGDQVALRTAIEQLGVVEVVTPSEAVAGLPGVTGTQNVFGAVIGITAFVGAAVVALLFALLVTERISLYGVLKALGVRSSAILGSLALQAALIAALASVGGTGLGLLLGNAVTSGPNAFVLTTSRAVGSGVLVIGSAVVGAAITLRKVLRIDPATAIGSSM